MEEVTPLLFLKEGASVGFLLGTFLVGPRKKYKDKHNKIDELRIQHHLKTMYQYYLSEGGEGEPICTFAKSWANLEFP